MCALIVDRLQMKLHKGLFSGINSPLPSLSCCHIPATAGNASPPASAVLCTQPCFAWWVSPAPAQVFSPLQSWQTFLSAPDKSPFFFLILQMLIQFVFLQSFMGFQVFLWDIPVFQYVDEIS